MITNENVLITGSRAPVALDLARNFKKNGYNVFCADSIKHPLCRFSNSCIRSFQVTSPRQNPEKYILELVSLCIAHRIKFIIPTCEEIFYLSKFKEYFLGIAEIFVDDYSKLRILHSKWDFISLLQSMNKEAPKSWLIQNLEDLKDISLRPLILKPVFSRFGMNIHLIKENEDFPSIDPSENYPWIAQEYLPGRVWCSYSVVKEGQVSLHTNYSSDFKVQNGASILFEHTPIPFIEEWVKTFVSEFKFTGQIAFDFIQTEDEKYIPIECNPRSTSGIHLLSNIPEFTHAFMNGQRRFIIQPSNGSSAILKLPMLAYGLSSIRSIKQLRKWFKAMRSKDVIFKASDPIPSIHQLITFFEFWIRGIKLGLDPIQASTYDIEFNGDL